MGDPGDFTREKKMDRYLIETPHTALDCLMLVDQVYAMGYLHHFDWGCPEGVHSAGRSSKLKAMTRLVWQYRPSFAVKRASSD